MLIALSILAALAAVIVIALLVASRRPDTFRYARTRTLPVAADAIMPHLVDFRRWSAWSPWEQLDPAMQREHGGPASGVGATYHWLGNKKVGEGRMTIIGATATELRIKLEFLKPWAATNDCIFALGSAATGTEVTWTMAGRSSLMLKVVGMVMNIEAMITRDFDRGLAGLEAAVTAGRA